MAGDDDEWRWTFAPRAANQFENLEHHVQDRIVSKLDEIVKDPWRDPRTLSNHLPEARSRSFVSGSTDACVLNREVPVLEVHRIEHRRGAYTADD